jgi:Family of unknown function (DUF6461)
VAYEWVGDVEAVAVTYVRGLDLRQVGDFLHFEWPTERETTFAEAEEQQDFDAETHAVQAEVVQSARGSWLVLIEPNGYLASMPEALEALSGTDVALSVYWNVNAQMRFAMYADGILVRSFDPLLRDLGPEGQPLVEEDGLAFGAESEPRASAMTLAERLTGVSVARGRMLDAVRRTWTATGFSAK